MHNDFWYIAKPFAKVNVKIGNDECYDIHEYYMSVMEKNQAGVRYVQFPSHLFFFQRYSDDFEVKIPTNDPNANNDGLCYDYVQFHFTFYTSALNINQQMDE